MLVELTYACSMNCSHCLSDCTPNGQRMTMDTLRDVLKFMTRHQIFSWNFSGGEIFEHPEILDALDLIKNSWDSATIKPVLVFITNGRRLARSKQIYNAVKALKLHVGKHHMLIQVTDDPRFYPDPLADREKYWLSKLGALIEKVPSSDPSDPSKCLYPQGRALTNFPEANWNTIAPKCINCRLITRQKPDITFTELVNLLLANNRSCTPVIAPDGSIKIGESALCPSVATIYNSDKVIIQRIREFTCQSCSIPWSRLKESNPTAYDIATR